MHARWIPIILVPLAAGACAQVLGLDEPRIDEGSGGAGGASGVGSTSSTSVGNPTTVVSSTGASSSTGEGGRDTTSSTSSTSSDASTGSGGGGQCVEHADCDDDNLCTADLCVDDLCFHEAIAAPQDDLTDCINVACNGDIETITADDFEDPPDPSPPCRTAVCSGGVPMNVDAEAGTSCGDPPLECDGDGECIGCISAEECGEETECASPLCGGDGVCDPGLVDEGTEVADPAGNCVRLECSGTSATPMQITDGTDTPADATCGTGFCSGSTPMQQPDNQGTPCSVGGFDGVCRGQQMTGDAACVQCVDEQQCDRALEGQECLEGDGNVCGCNGGADCEEPWRAGERCLPVAGPDRCGCAIASDCEGNGHGDDCLGDGTCGCNLDEDCMDAALGQLCIGTQCGCNSAADCAGSPIGDACVDGQCGCAVENDCTLSQNCVDGFCI
jgi:hypothetical protein